MPNKLLALVKVAGNECLRRNHVKLAMQDMMKIKNRPLTFGESDRLIRQNDLYWFALPKTAKFIRFR